MQHSFDIRKAFLDFFASKGHRIMPSSNLITDDKSLLFVNAGMVPFKKYFLNEETPTYSTMTTAQKCLRVSGKHNDLDQVGFTKRHHTFFEMLGNFSFGKYFKSEVIPYAWEFLTKVLCLDPKRLYITVFAEDQEAFNIWKKITGFEDSKIIKIATSDNFWSMGDTGPCGPCSEIFYDHGDKYPGDIPGSGNELDRFIEIWNLVFMQKNKVDENTMVDLDKKCIDTGMGLERISAVMNNTPDNYETDLFTGLLNAEYEILGCDDPKNPAYRVIADHVRSSCFLLSEGLLPSNEGRGYVLRRIIRRAVNYLYKINKEKFLYEICNFFVDDFSKSYPELSQNKEFILDAVKNEENLFKESYFKGFKILEKELTNTNKISGEFAFKLYDTYGFPLDVTCNIVKSYDGTVDIDGFDQLMQAQREKSKQGLKMLQSGDDFHKLFYMAKEKGVNLSETQFLGYADHEVQGVKILAIFENGQFVTELQNGTSGIVVFDKTVFYAESGGQIADRGVIRDGMIFGEVTDVKKQDNVFFHFVNLQKGYLKIWESVDMQIDVTRRRRIAANHTATHILHNVLREELGKFVTQHGSMVSDEKLRFDFNYQQPLGKEILKKIEQKVNDVIAQNITVTTNIKDQKTAVQEGAMALFGEKYGDKVRVVSVENEKFLSKELCGGTHVKSTSEIGIFKILSESSIASGIRRIEAITSYEVYEHLCMLEKEVLDVKNILGVSSGIEAKLTSLIEENKKLLLQNNNFIVSENISNSKKINRGEFDCVFSFVQNLDQQLFRSMSDRFLQKFTQNTVVILANMKEGKISFTVALTKDLSGKLYAKEILLKIISYFGAKGCGGRDDFAQGGINLENSPEDVKEKFDSSKYCQQNIENALINIIKEAI